MLRDKNPRPVSSKLFCPHDDGFQKISSNDTKVELEPDSVRNSWGMENQKNTKTPFEPIDLNYSSHEGAQYFTCIDDTNMGLEFLVVNLSY